MTIHAPPRTVDDGRTIEYRLPGAMVTLRQTGGSFDAKELVDIALRRGSTRPFLFVSKVLGKHIAAAPGRMSETHRSLATELRHDMPGPVLFIGMGETATGLGWGVYEAWKARTGRTDCLFIHSTRYVVSGHDTIYFAEEHSHAPHQLICVPRQKSCYELFQSAGSLIVVDDEITSGRTIKALRQALDFRGVRPRQSAAVSLITALPHDGHGASDVLDGWQQVSLAQVSVDCIRLEESPLVEQLSQGVTFLDRSTGALSWGRVGARDAPALPARFLETLLPKLSARQHIAVIGSGELMHPAYVLARAFENHGFDVSVQATTRSPVRLGGAIESSMVCDDCLGSGADYYLHNPPAMTDVFTLLLCEPGGVSRARRLSDVLEGLVVEVWDA